MHSTEIPRDLFDVKYLLEAEGFTQDQKVKEGFMLYLLCSDRPINEIISERPHNMTETGCLYSATAFEHILSSTRPIAQQKDNLEIGGVHPEPGV
jgi:hypothetical protein